MAYIYQADIYCDACGKRICENLTASKMQPENPDDEHSYDSGDYPKHANDDDETDSPQHCACGPECLRAEELPSGEKIGALIGTRLTEYGLQYLKEQLIEGGEVAEFWREQFTEGGHPGLDKFSLFAEVIARDLIPLLATLKKDIGDEYRASDDPEDETPGMQITIACNKEMTDWTYQTGDNSYSGSCYHYPYWGVGSLYRDTKPEDLADELIDDMLNQIEE